MRCAAPSWVNNLPGVGYLPALLSRMEGDEDAGHGQDAAVAGVQKRTKTLSFNIDDICYADSAEQRTAYIEYIDEAYNAERLTGILTDVANIIGANILNVARQDDDPQRA
jgi:hypothetical protein